MRRILTCFFIIAILVSQILGFSRPAEASAYYDGSENGRISPPVGSPTVEGEAVVISDHFKQFKMNSLDSVIIASSLNYEDGLSASILSGEFGAPIYLVQSSASQPDKGTKLALNDIINKLKNGGCIFIIGGDSIIHPDFETVLSSKGKSFKFVRLSGNNTYETNIKVINQAKVPAGKSIFVASGEVCADAISASSYSSQFQYPIVLTSRSGLSDESKQYIASQRPSNIYIIGGTGVIPLTVENDLKSLVPSSSISRIAGHNQYDTNIALAQKFDASPQRIYIAGADEYQYALAGSTLASEDAAPVILIDADSTKLPSATETYFSDLHTNNLKPELISLGTVSDVPTEILEQCNNALAGKGQKSVVMDDATLKGEANAKADQIIAQLITPNMNDLEKELAIYDYVISHVKYDYGFDINNPNNEHDEDEIGGLVYGKAVCGGYSVLMKYLLNKVGIESNIVYGKAGGYTDLHAWNNIKIGGNYYQLDATFDSILSVKGGLKHSYFNLTDSEMSSDHTWDAGAYPACTSTLYDKENYSRYLGN